MPSTPFSLRLTASMHVGEARARRLEVERKFAPTRVSLAYLRSNGEGSRFTMHSSLGQRIIHDIYYDRDNVLFPRGVYIRRRNGRWETEDPHRWWFYQCSVCGN